MSTRRCLIAIGWLSMLSLLAWAAAPERSQNAAPAWEWTTFVTELGAVRGDVDPGRWLAAEPGGYARPSARHEGAGYRNSRDEVIDPPHLADVRRATPGAYLDLGR